MEKDKKNEILNQENKMKEEKKGELLAQKNEYEDKLKVQEEKLKSEKQEELSAQKNEYEDRLKEQKENLEKDKKNEILDQENKYKKMIAEEVEEKNIYINKLEKIENYFSSYKELMEKMKKAQSLKELSNSFESDNEDIKMLKFIQFFGNGEEYLKTIYAEFKDKKMNEKISLTSEEIEFINFTNKFFKEKNGMEEDVLTNVRVNEDKFDKSTMQDILKPSDFSFKIVEEFYVPGVKTKNLNLKAIVKGRK